MFSGSGYSITLCKILLASPVMNELVYHQARCTPFLVILMLNKNTLGVKKVRGQSEAAFQIGMYDQKR